MVEHHQTTSFDHVTCGSFANVWLKIRRKGDMLNLRNLITKKWQSWNITSLHRMNEHVCFFVQLQKCSIYNYKYSLLGTQVVNHTKHISSPHGYLGHKHWMCKTMSLFHQVKGHQIDQCTFIWCCYAVMTFGKKQTSLKCQVENLPCNKKHTKMNV